VEIERCGDDVNDHQEMKKENQLIDFKSDYL
jgi:hypothetical protein